VLRGVTRIMTYLPPGDKTSVDFEIMPGMLAATDLLHKTSISLFTNETQGTDQQSLSLKMQEQRFQLLDRQVRAEVLSVLDVVVNMEQYAEIGTGRLRVEIENVRPSRCAIWMMNLPTQGALAANLPQFEPFLSGKKLLTTQTFRDLFRTEVIDAAEGIAIRDITFLFTDLKGSTALYDQIGDPKAYFLVRQHFDTLGQAIADKSGAVVKTIGDAVMATFENPANAVDAALTMIERIEAFNQNISQPLILKIGIHKGHSIAVTLNDRLDYFGQTVNIASRIQSLADANEIYVSSAVYDAPGVAETLRAHHVTPEQASVKGVSEKLQVYKIKVRK
jgi:class 3 adenylate cyclase